LRIAAPGARQGGFVRRSELIELALSAGDDRGRAVPHQDRFARARPIAGPQAPQHRGAQESRRADVEAERDQRIEGVLRQRLGNRLGDGADEGRDVAGEDRVRLPGADVV